MEKQFFNLCMRYVIKFLVMVFKWAWRLGIVWLGAVSYILDIIKKGNGILGAILEIPFFIIGLGGMAYFIYETYLRFKYKNPKFQLWKHLLNNRNQKGFVAKTNEYKTGTEATGVVFGKLKGQYITKTEDKDGHILVIGGAGSGKSSCIAIPTLKAWQGRVFAIDIKGELYEKTNADREAAMIKVFNPTDRQSFKYNPYYLFNHTDDVYAEAKDLAIAILPLSPSDKNPYFTTTAQSLLTGLMLYFYEREYSFAGTMKEIKLHNIRDLIAEAIKFGSDKVKMELSQFDGMDEKTLSNVYSTLSNGITLFATNDDLQWALDNDSECITPQDLENGFDIYLNIPEHKLEQWKILLSMMCNQFLKAFERRPNDNKKPILFLIDEMARIGKIETITNGLATLRSKKITIALFVQSKSQLNAIYGNDVAEIIADNCSYKAILKASEPNTQEWCSKLVGTYEKQKISHSSNRDEFGISKGSGASTTVEDKRIIKPEEFAYLDDIVCLFPTGYLRIDKAPYYLEK
ncbi:MAG: type IV secretory system conjugative DNA transfer family protein [Clostridium celatum]|nr:type IV secretory system conjugative DNA transfer family protein [Clostridium celatum]